MGNAVATTGRKLPVDPAARKALLENVLERYQGGETIAEIARDIGCTDPPIYHALLEHDAERWKAISSAHALARLDDAEREADTAQDALSLARARARGEFARWKLEKLLRRYFGQDIPADLAGRITINISTGNEPRTIEHEAEVLQVPDKPSE